jgi:hypothetical protein
VQRVKLLLVDWKPLEIEFFGKGCLGAFWIGELEVNYQFAGKLNDCWNK